MEDILLISNIQRDDKKSFKKLFVSYYSPLCEYASQYVPDHYAEEIVEDLMVYLWENRKSLQISSSVKSYLFTATKYRCLNAIKSQQCHQQKHSEIYDALHVHFEDPDYYLSGELADQIEKAIESLPDSYKEVFIRSRMQEMSYQEIADELGVSKKTIEYRMSNALKLLRTALKDYLPLMPLVLYRLFL